MFGIVLPAAWEIPVHRLTPTGPRWVDRPARTLGLLGTGQATLTATAMMTWLSAPMDTIIRKLVREKSLSGMAPPVDWAIAARPDWSAETDTAGAQLGYVVRSAGDVNHDGFADLLATAYNFPVPDNGGTLAGAGAWFVWLGSSSGLGDPGTPANADIAQYCNQAAHTAGATKPAQGMSTVTISATSL